MSGRQKLCFAALLLLALVVRFAYYKEIRPYILYQVPLIDAEDYVEWGAALAAGEEEIRDVYYKAPLYPHVLGWCMRVLGPRPATAHALNVFLGILNLALIGIWLRRLAGACWALLGVALAVLYGPFLYFEAQALPTILGLTFALLSLLALSSHACRPGWGAAGGAGVSLGLLALTRPSFLPWALAAPLWVWLGTPRDRKRALLVMTMVVVVVLPVTVRNRVVGGTWVPISANGGINFFLGNNAEAARTSAMRPGLEWEELVTSIPAAERKGQARWDRYFAHLALEWIVQRPGDFVAGLGKKTLQFLNTHEIDRNLDVRGFRAQSRTLRWSLRYACLAPWILLGCVVAWRRAGMARLALLYFLACLSATVLIFVTERYRTDATPAALALMIFAIIEITAHLRRRRAHLGGKLVAVLLLAGGFLAFNNLFGVRNVNPAQASVLEGMAFYKQARYGRAVESLRRALEEYPEDANAHYQLGTALQKQNRFDEALAEYEVAHRFAPGHPKPLVAAGAIYRRRGERDRARQRYEAALATDPGNPLIHLELGSLLEESGDHVNASSHYEEVLRLTSESLVLQEARRALERISSDSRSAP